MLKRVSCLISLILIVEKIPFDLLEKLLNKLKNGEERKEGERG